MNSLVILRNEQAVTTSLNVADYFHKRHDHVLRDIEALKKDVPNFGEMFFESNREDSYGRLQRMFFMNRDGFSLLAMGFTGSEAMKWKVNYIRAFNAMEEELNSPEQIMARALRVADETIKKLTVDVERMKPKEIFADAIVASTTTIYVGEFAKILKQNGIETGQNRFFKQLVEDHFLLKRNGQYEPTQYAMKLKLFEIDSKPVRIGDETQIKRTVKVTPQGQKYLINKYLGEREEILNDRHSEKFNTIYGNNETLSRSCI